eukprot:TRINITY_DN41336_c0_g1_i1.p1 TRINITY_DN41336_c0_g1~~TRINITY_DN41336_c0_g1_i1.p1  ORF type:complete len:310 (-),score=61.31 TRINITY_DN41336_c0_g1_i1:61-990(-)
MDEDLPPLIDSPPESFSATIENDNNKNVIVRVKRPREESRVELFILERDARDRQNKERRVATLISTIASSTPSDLESQNIRRLMGETLKRPQLKRLRQAEASYPSQEAKRTHFNPTEDLVKPNSSLLSWCDIVDVEQKNMKPEPADESNQEEFLRNEIQAWLREASDDDEEVSRKRTLTKSKYVYDYFVLENLNTDATFSESLIVDSSFLSENDWLFRDTNHGDESDSGYDDEDEDSNDENYYTNDYPEEEAIMMSGDDLSSDDGEDRWLNNIPEDKADYHQFANLTSAMDSLSLREEWVNDEGYDSSD